MKTSTKVSVCAMLASALFVLTPAKPAVAEDCTPLYVSTCREICESPTCITGGGCAHGEPQGCSPCLNDYFDYTCYYY